MRDIPFSYESYIPEGDVVMSRADLKGENIGIYYNDVQQDIVVNYAVIVFYSSGMKKEFKESVVIRKGEEYHIDGELLSTAFHDHFTYGKIKSMEVIIMPTDCYPIKWRIKVEE